MSHTEPQHRSSGVIGEIAGRPVLMHFGDVSAEYAALSTSAMVIDRTYRGRMEMAGPKAAEMLNGLITNEVKIPPGTGTYGAVLSAKGKVLADVRVFVRQDGLLIDTSPRSAQALRETLKKFVNPRAAPHRDVSETLADIGVFGPRAAQIIAEALRVSADELMALPMYGHINVGEGDAEVIVARVPDLAVPGFELFVPATQSIALREKVIAAGATPGGHAAFEIARVEAGRPEWGIDMDDNTIPQEANFDDLAAVSYTKGCYVGQETVARVHFRGHVNRHLRGLRFAGGELPPTGTPLIDHEEKVIGDVRSTALSPTVGPIAIGMVRREIPLGATITARSADDNVRATVVALPFVI